MTDHGPGMDPNIGMMRARIQRSKCVTAIDELELKRFQLQLELEQVDPKIEDQKEKIKLLDETIAGIEGDKS